jgi:lipoprotein-releasing system permease protein
MVSLYIARRIAISTKASFSKLIIRIAITAIALSVAVMILATALVAGFKNTISNKVFDFWGHIHITHFDTKNDIESVPITRKQPFYSPATAVQPSVAPQQQLTQSPNITFSRNYTLLGISLFNKDVSTQGGIRHIQAYANKAGIIKTKDQLEGIILKGIDTDYDWGTMRQYLVQGNELLLPDTISRSILISETTARRIKANLGDKLVIYFIEPGSAPAARWFSITGIYKTGLEEYDKKIALVDIRQIQNLNHWGRDSISGFEVFLDHIADLDPYTEYVYEQIGSDLNAQSIKSIFPAIFSWLSLQNANERVILSIMIFVSIINMITALLILILERTNMIGTLKALGARNWDIRKIFLLNAAYITLWGLLIGNIIGISLGLLQKHFHLITLPEDLYYVSVAPIEFQPLTLLLLNIGTLLITILALIIPSLLITRITPVKAIRFK